MPRHSGPSDAPPEGGTLVAPGISGAVPGRDGPCPAHVLPVGQIGRNGTRPGWWPPGRYPGILNRPEALSWGGVPKHSRKGGRMSANSFYDSYAWRKVRREVLAMDHNECQICRDKHRHSRGVIVHHVYHLDQYPEYGLMVWVDNPNTGERKRNLLTVCRDCHETVCHPERLPVTSTCAPLTQERW